MHCFIHFLSESSSPHITCRLSCSTQICAALLAAFSFYSFAVEHSAAAADAAVAATATSPVTPATVRALNSTAFAFATSGLHFELANRYATRYDLIGLPVGCVALLLVCILCVGIRV